MPRFNGDAALKVLEQYTAAHLRSSQSWTPFDEGEETDPCTSKTVSSNDKKTCSMYCEATGEDGKTCVDSCKYKTQVDGGCWLTPSCGSCDQSSTGVDESIVLGRG